LRTRDNLTLEGKPRQDALQKRIDKSEDPDANMGEQDEQWRVEVLVERRFKIAGKAASRYFEQRTLSEECQASSFQSICSPIDQSEVKALLWMSMIIDSSAGTP
jgi:hypothetical protein